MEISSSVSAREVVKRLLENVVQDEYHPGLLEWHIFLQECQQIWLKNGIVHCPLYKYQRRATFVILPHDTRFRSCGSWTNTFSTMSLHGSMQHMQTAVAYMKVEYILHQFRQTASLQISLNSESVQIHLIQLNERTQGFGGTIWIIEETPSSRQR